MSKVPLQSPRGTRDFYPEDLRVRAWLFEHFREVARRFGFEEVDAPIVEHAELIAAVFALVDRLGLAPGDVRMRVNSRALLEETLREGPLAQRPDAFAPLCVIVDKLDKIGAEAVTEQLCDPAGPVALDPAQAKAVVEGLGVRSLEEAARRHREGSRGLADLRRLFELLDAYGVAD